MDRKKKALAGIALASSVAALSAVAHAGVNIGNWENQTDGWFDWPSDNGTNYMPPPTFPGGGEYTYSSIGATLGSSSLAVNPGGGGYTQSLAIKLEYVTDGNGNNEMQDFLNNTEFSINETMNSAEWGGAGTYAVTQLIINAPGIGFDTIGLPTTDTRNPGFPGGYTASAYPGISTSTMTWNYASLLPTIGANPGYVEFVFVTVSDYPTVGNWYFDNAQLTNPPVNTTWNNLGGDGKWTTAGNWSSGVPSNPGDTATFSTATAGGTVTLDSSESVGVLDFNGPSYTIAPGTGTTLTLDNGGAPGQINDLFGSQVISAPVSLAANTMIAVGQSTDTLTISGNISGNGGITLLGTSTAQAIGTVVLSGTNTYHGATTVSTGTLEVAAPGALPSTTSLTVGTATTTALVQLGMNSGAQTISGLTINAGSTLDITNNHMFVNYAAGTQAATDSTIRGLLVSGYAGGNWNGAGIDSSTAATTPGFAVGYADGADGVVSGLSSGQIELKYTRYGDANLDGVVSGVDFTILVGNLGKSVSGWDQGDFNYDGVVSGVDFTLLVGNLGKAANGADITLPAADLAAIDAFAAANGLMASVPEPASAGLLIAAGVGMLARRRRSS